MSSMPEAPQHPPPPEALEPPLSVAALDPAEREYVTARAAFLTPERSQASAVFLLVTMALFALSMRQGTQAWTDIALLVAVLLFHELGHWVGMRLFGFRDVQMFFIPFLGAAVSGRNAGAVAWKEALVLLMGPLPGLLLGTALVIWTAFEPSHLAASVGVLLVAINAFNLLPLAPLDGGKLFQLLLFSRHRVLEVAFTAFAGLALGGLALVLGIWALGVVAGLVILSIPRLRKVLYAAALLRATHPGALRDPAELDEPSLRGVYAAAGRVVPAELTGDSALTQRVRAMRDVHHHARMRPPSVLASLGLFLAWGLGAVLTLAGFVTIGGGYTPRAPRWTPFTSELGAFTALLPVEAPSQGAILYGPRSFWQRGGGTYQARLWIDHDYSVTYWTLLEAPASEQGREQLLAEVKEALTRWELNSPREAVLLDEARELAGVPGRHLAISGQVPLGEGERRVDYWFGLRGERGYILRAEYDSRLAGPQEAEGFFASFRPLP